jgi:hypothetical protein
MTKRETESIEKLSEDAEVVLGSDYGKKDLKEKRALAKETLYDGSKKLKHSLPRGKKA